MQKRVKVDCQSHIFPAGYAEMLKQNTGSVQTSGGYGTYCVDYGGIQQFTFDVDVYSPERKIQAMDEAGIDVSLISINMPGPECLDTELGVKAARWCNDYLAEVCQQYPGRFAGIASLPLQDVPAAIAEMDHAIDELDSRGVMLFSHIGGRPVDTLALEPFYAQAERRNLPLVIHPTVPTWGSAIKDYAMIPMIGLMMDTSIAMLRLILSGILERHPGLQIVHPHAGGVLPYLMGRVQEQTQVKRRGCEHITQSPQEIYRRIYLDTVSPSPLALRYAYDFAGADRLLFGSDHPWVNIGTFIELIAGLDIPEVDKAKIMGLNACKLFGIEY